MNTAPAIERDAYGRRAVYLTNEQEQQLRRSPDFITPSNINPWRGVWDDGQVYTREQLYKLRTMGIAAETADRLDVQVKVTVREWSWSMFDPTPIRRIPCPVVRRVGERLEIIAPRGVIKRAYADGHLTRPATRKRGGFLGR